MTRGKVDALIQARMGSERLPGKILLQIAGKPLLRRVLDQLKKAHSVDRVIVATTTNVVDDAVEEYCLSQGVLCYRGSVDNVLQRYIGACDKFGVKRLARVCSDNPLIDPDLLDELASSFLPNVDYCSYYTELNSPLILEPSGLFAELTTSAALKRSLRFFEKNGDAKIIEHVTFHMHQNPDKYKIKKVTLPDWIDPKIRLTVDFPEDVDFIESFITQMLDREGGERAFRILRSDPILAKRMRAFSERNPKVY